MNKNNLKFHDINNPEWIEWLTSELIKVYNETGKIPGRRLLQKIGRYDLLHATTKSSRLTNHEKNLTYYLKLANIDVSERKKLVWKKGYLESEIKKIVEKDGKFPSWKRLVEVLGGGVKDPICKASGLKVICEKMGFIYNGKYKSRDGHYLNSSYEYIFDEFLYSYGIPHEVDKYINLELGKYRYDFKVNDIYFEIWEYSEDKNNSRSKLYCKKKELKLEIYRKNNLNLVSIDGEFIKTCNNIEEYFKEIFNKLNIETKIVYPFNQKELMDKCSFATKEEVIISLKEIINKIGNFPKSNDIHRENSQLYSLIRNYGGFVHFREVMGNPLLL